MCVLCDTMPARYVKVSRKLQQHNRALDTRSKALTGALSIWLMRYGTAALADVRRKLESGGYSALRRSYVEKRISAAQLGNMEEQLRGLLIRYGVAQAKEGGQSVAGPRWEIRPELLSDIFADKQNKVVLLVNQTESSVRGSIKTLLSEAMDEIPQPTSRELGRRIARSWFGPSMRAPSGQPNVGLRGTPAEQRLTADWARSMEDVTTDSEHLFSPQRAQTIARTELAQARGQGQAQAYTDIGVEEIEWLAYPNDGRSGKREHWKMNGKRITVKAMNGSDSSKWFQLPSGIMTPYPNWMGLPPGETVNCFVGDTVVSGPEAQKAYRHHYRGPLQVLTTASGKELAGTPNHPILTARGWAPLHLIEKDDHLVCCGEPDVAPGREPDIDCRPTKIAEVFATLSESGKIERVGRLAVDFHGDRPTSDIDIVHVDSKLWGGFGPQTQEHLGNLALADTNAKAILLHCLGALELLMLRYRHGSPRAVRRFGEALAFSLVCLAHSDKHGFGSASRCDAGFSQPDSDGSSADPVFLSKFFLTFARKILADNLVGRDAASLHGVDTPPTKGTGNSPVTDAEFGRDLTDTLPGKVFFDRVINRQVRQFEGHVFNLETVTGWYLANGIAVKNCRCNIIATS